MSPGTTSSNAVNNNEPWLVGPIGPVPSSMRCSLPGLYSPK